MSSFEQVHAGDTVLGHDGEVWGVEAIERAPRLAVTLVKYGVRVTGYPPPGTPVTVVTPADLSAEFWAAQVLIDAFGSVEVISERV